MKLAVKLASLLYSLLLFGVGFNWLHELGHWQVAQWVGVPGGKILITWTGGRYLYPEGFAPSVSQDFWVSLGGGFGVALFFAIGWLIRQASLSWSRWDLDDTVSLFAVGVWQALYAVSEVFNWQFYGAGLSAAIGFGLALLIYGKALLRWLEGEN